MKKAFALFLLSVTIKSFCGYDAKNVPIPDEIIIENDTSKAITIVLETCPPGSTVLIKIDRNDKRGKIFIKHGEREYEIVYKTHFDAHPPISNDTVTLRYNMSGLVGPSRIERVKESCCAIL